MSVQLGREIGRGGMATVYVGRDERLGREVAVKVLHRRLLADREAVARFEREAQIVARLEHPNILRVYGVEDLEDGRIGLVMPFVRGGTLADLLKRSGGGLPLREVIRITGEVLRGLSYAHARGVVHRDIKPGNIFLESDTGRVLVADFGIARAAGAHTALTQTGSSMGTPNYMAPEQIDSVSNVDGRADLYAMGMVMWEMLTGEQPWSGETLFSVIFKQKTEDLPSPALTRPDLPEHVVDVWRVATRKEREARWESAEAMLSEFENMASSGDSTKSSVPAATDRSGGRAEESREPELVGLHARQPPLDNLVARDPLASSSRVEDAPAPTPGGPGEVTRVWRPSRAIVSANPARALVVVGCLAALPLSAYLVLSWDRAEIDTPEVIVPQAPLAAASPQERTPLADAAIRTAFLQGVLDDFGIVVPPPAFAHTERAFSLLHRLSLVDLGPAEVSEGILQIEDGGEPSLRPETLVDFAGLVRVAPAPLEPQGVFLPLFERRFEETFGLELSEMAGGPLSLVIIAMSTGDYQSAMRVLEDYPTQLTAFERGARWWNRYFRAIALARMGNLQRARRVADQLHYDMSTAEGSWRYPLWDLIEAEADFAHGASPRISVAGSEGSQAPAFTRAEDLVAQVREDVARTALTLARHLREERYQQAADLLGEEFRYVRYAGMHGSLWSVSSSPVPLTCDAEEGRLEGQVYFYCGVASRSHLTELLKYYGDDMSDALTHMVQYANAIAVVEGRATFRIEPVTAEFRLGPSGWQLMACCDGAYY